MTGLTATFGAFLADPPAIPRAVIERAKVSLVHNIVMAMSGRGRETVAHRVAAGRGDAATLLATGQRSSADWAALANGALFHARSQDDVHLASTSHPGAPVTAAALAVAEEQGATGRAFLESLVLGYEVLCRVGRDFDQEVSRRGFRAAAIWGGFGAAAAAAYLRGMNASATGHALALCSHQAGGLLQVWREGSAEYPFHLGFAARNGVVAAELAAAGATAGQFMLEGPEGLYAAAAGADGPPVEALAGLGTDWQISEVTVKPYPACAVLQGPLDLALRLREQAGGAQVVGASLTLSPFEATFPGIDNPGPVYSGPTATKMSAQFCLGSAFAHGRLALADLSQTGDAAILAVAGRVQVSADPALHDRQCRLDLRLADGRRLHAALDGPIGQPDFAGIAAFAHRMTSEMGATPEAVDRLAAEVAALQDRASLAPLMAAIAGLRG